MAKAGDTTIRKRYSVEVPGHKPVILRYTSTLAHAAKHAGIAAELQITVIVRDTETQVTIVEVPAVDRYHARKAHGKRDRTYKRLAKRR